MSAPGRQAMSAPGRQAMSAPGRQAMSAPGRQAMSAPRWRSRALRAPRATRVPWAPLRLGLALGVGLVIGIAPSAGLDVAAAAPAKRGDQGPANAEGKQGARRGKSLDRGLRVTVKRGDSAEELAERYYGETWAARALLLANGESGFGRRLPRLRPGTAVRLPTAWSYRIRSGDTWEILARDYLGDASHARFLATINGKEYRPGEAAPRRHVITIPTLLRVQVPHRFGLTRLVARLLDRRARDPRVLRLAKWVEMVNKIRGRLRGGQNLVIPLASLRLLGWYLPNSLPRPDPGTRRRARRRLGQARTDLRRGRYVTAAARLGPVLGWPGLPDAQAVQALRLRCTAWVALGRRALALQAAREALRIQPELTLDPVDVSPKVRAVFQRAKQGPTGSARPRPRARGRPNGRPRGRPGPRPGN